MKTFYLSPTGNDLNNGLSQSTPLRTFAAALSKGFTNGDTLLLHAAPQPTSTFDPSKGQGFAEYKTAAIHESITLSGMSNITIAPYGAGQPLIIPGAASGITLTGCHHITVSGIKLLGQGWKICNKSMGISIRDCRHVLIENVEVAGFHSAGINVFTSEYVDILGCYAHDNGSVGIATGGEQGENTRRCRHIRIAHCKAFDNAGDYTTRRNHSGNGIVIAGTFHCVVEFCEAAGNGWGQRQTYVNGPVGLWACCGCDDVIFRYCIGRHNRTQPGAVDGDGFDIDGEVENSAIEYCYSYGNEGAGYLHCEFWGTYASKNWRNNHNRYSVSFEDDIRVGDYGALAISSPHEVPMEKLYVENNLFVAGKAAAIYNRDLKPQVKDIFITNNVLITAGDEAIQNTTHVAMNVEGNDEIRDVAVRDAFVVAAPLLTNPRHLPGLPLYRMLEEKTCAAAIQSGNMAGLFGEHAGAGKKAHAPAPAPGSRLMELRLYDMDLDGCDHSGNVRLSYDSLRPGVVTRLTGAGSQVHTPLPWWTDRRQHLVRIFARLTAPDTVACLFVRHDNGKPEERVYLAGNTSEYHMATLQFLPDDKWEDPGKHVGVRVESGAGDVLVHAIEFFELPENAPEAAAPSLDSLDNFRQYGDVYEEDGEFVLNGVGAGLCLVLQVPPGACTVAFEYKQGEGGETAACVNGESRTLPPGADWQRATFTADAATGILDIGIFQMNGGLGAASRLLTRIRNVTYTG